MAVSNRWKTCLRIFMYMHLYTLHDTRHNNLFANFHGISTGRLVEFHKLIGHFVEFLYFWLRFHQKTAWSHQQLDTTSNHIHPKSFTLQSVTWTYMYMLWDTTVKKKSEILKCHHYLGFFFFFFLCIYMWRQQYIIICILIPNRV